MAAQYAALSAQCTDMSPASYPCGNARTGALGAASLWQLDAHVRQCCETFDFHGLFRELYNFCTVDLSAFYFDIRKDCLYCDPITSPTRRAAQTVLAELFDCLTAWLAPILCFTAEEAWLQRNPGETESIHLRTFPEITDDWRNDPLGAKWEDIRQVRRVVLGALEIERAEKRSAPACKPLPAFLYRQKSPGRSKTRTGGDRHHIRYHRDRQRPANAFTLPDVAGIAVLPDKAKGQKCERCWKVLPEVGLNPEYPDICGRCADAVSGFQEAAE